MNNEERILAILESMQADISGLKEDVSSLKSGQAKLEADVSDLKSGQAELRADVSDLKADVAGIKLRLENEFTQKFNLLAEGQQTILEKMATKNSVEELKKDQNFLKQVVALHSIEIAELKKAE